MISQLLVKIKEETMSQERILMDLEEAFGRLSDGLNAVELMVLGLEDVQDPYADGLYVIWRYLEREREEIERLLAAVSSARISA